MVPKLKAINEPDQPHHNAAQSSIATSFRSYRFQNLVTPLWPVGQDPDIPLVVTNSFQTRMIQSENSPLMTTIRMMWNQLTLGEPVAIDERCKRVSLPNGFLMTLQRTAEYARTILTYSGGNITAEIVESKIIYVITSYSLVCKNCSNHYEYAVGYAD